MATGDDRYQPALTQANLQKLPRPDPVPMLAEVQEQLRKLFEVVAKLEGRLGTIALRNSVTIAGSLTVRDGVSLGAVLETAASPAPSVSDPDTGTIYYDATDNVYKISENGSPYQNLWDAASYGNWRSTATAVGAGSYVWDTEDQNTGDYARQAGDTQIVVGFTGTILVLASPVVTTLVGDTNVKLFLNATEVARSEVPLTIGATSQGYLNHITPVVDGDFVEITNAAGDRYGAADFFTRLTIARIR